jgi:hypothetical protein
VVGVTALAVLLATAIAINYLLLFPWALWRFVKREGIGAPWLAWAPFANLTFIPRLADASVLAVLLLFIPLVNYYVWWDWWSDIAANWYHRHPNVWALGFFVPFLDTVLLFRFVGSLPKPVQKTLARPMATTKVALR